MTEEEQQLIRIGAESSLKPFINLLERLFGGSVDEIGGQWQDAFRTRRRIRRIELYKKLQKAIDEAGFAPQLIADDISLPALQQASLVDDETLQAKWANLLANASDPRGIASVIVGFPTMLKDLTPRDVKFLDALYDHISNLDNPRRFAERSVTGDTVLGVYARAGLSRHMGLATLSAGDRTNRGDEIRADFQEFGITLATIQRLRILDDEVTVQPMKRLDFHKGLAANSPITNIGTKRVYRFSELGLAFIKACRPPEQMERD